MNEKTFTRIVITYLVIAVITFGHCWSRNQFIGEEQRVFCSFFAAVAWPCYVSAKIWAIGQPEQPYQVR